MPEPTARLRRLPQMMLFAGFTAWYFGARELASRAASGLTMRFSQGAGRGLLEACFHLFLLVIGYLALEAMARQSIPLRELTALPRRPAQGREWLTGAALGWGMVVALLLPMILSGHLHGAFTLRPAELGAAGLTLLTLAIATLAHEITFRGYPFRCLTESVGSSFAVVLMVAAAGFSAWHNPDRPGAAVASTMLLTLLLSLTWLRTHAVWLAWGLHFALAAATGVLFGLPLGGSAEYATVVHGSTYGGDWLTGGDYGPSAALFSLVVLLAAVPVLYRITREFAWNYTHRAILPAGYEVNIAAPAAHTAMEETAAKTPALVQILGATPQGMSGEPRSPAPPPPAPDRLH